MVDRKRALSAEERLQRLRRDQARVRRERMARTVAGDRWKRMARLVPVLFSREGEIVARVVRAPAASVIEALREDAVFALDSAMRLTRGCGFLSGGDVHAYVTSREALDRLAARGLVDAADHPDKVLVRPWAGPPRILACVVGALPDSVMTPAGVRVVTDERMRRELIGAVGLRADLFALAELPWRDAVSGGHHRRTKPRRNCDT